ncbi:Tryptophan synthase beta chain 2 chloroplastic [Bienertia sinuspersici]
MSSSFSSYMNEMNMHMSTIASAFSTTQQHEQAIMAREEIEENQKNSLVHELLRIPAMASSSHGAPGSGTNTAVAWIVILGSIAGLHSYPMMVRDFHVVISKEARRLALEKWGGKPDMLVSCGGGGLNAMGLFHKFVEDEDFSLIAVEVVGFSLDIGKHAITLTKGEVGVLHGLMEQ